MKKPTSFICERCKEECYGDDFIFDLSSEGVGHVCETCFLFHAKKDDFCSEEDFEEIRAYEFGDDIRDIDWRVTARKQNPYTKIYAEEKDREAQKRAAEKNNARKPSAILEEIEGMFGAPELTDYTIE